MLKVTLLLKWFASFQTFHLWQGAAGAACCFFNAIESQSHEYECGLVKSWPLIHVTKIKDSCLVLAQGCIKNAQPHLTLSKGLFLHLQSAGRSSSHRFFLSYPGLFARLILHGFQNDRLTQSPFVCMSDILAGCPLKREEIGKSNLIFPFLV